MKVLWITLLLIGLTAVAADERPLEKTKKVIVEKKASFQAAYQKIRKEEGYYNNDPVDLGGETYAGITMRYNPEWYGWRYIHGKKFKRNQYSPEAEFWVLDYYLTIWVKEGFYDLHDQDIANYLFDTRVNISSYETIRLLNRYHQANLEFIDNWVHPRLDSMNLNTFRKSRIHYYSRIIKKRPEQIKWKKAWFARAAR